MAERPGPFAAGASLVWRRQRVLWWIYALNLILALFAIHGMTDRLGQAVNHSLASQRLVHGFDVSALAELSLQPDAPLQMDHPAMLHFAIVFAIGMLFLTGGVLATYYRDAHLTTALFFEACGECFWRFFRLMIYFLIVVIPVGLLCAGAEAMYDRIDEQSISPFPAVWFIGIAALLILLIAMIVRLWFDMAQVIAVAEDERRMHSALRRAATLLRGNFGSLFWLYFRISFVAMLVFAIGAQFWKNYLPPDKIIAAFFVSQLLMVWWLGTRLWQRASEVEWYRQHIAEANVPVPVAEPVPVLSASAVETPV